MEWYFTLALILGSLLFLLILLRVPVFVGLLGISTIVIVLEYGVEAAARTISLGFASSLVSQALAPVVLFYLMGEILFRAGVVSSAIHAVTRALNRVPGKLALSATISGGVLGAVSGSPMASTALLGKNLIPETTKYNYKAGLAAGSVMSAGGLAMVVPPSTVIVVLGATAGIPVGPLLIAGIVPGLLMLVGYLIVQFIWVIGFKGDGDERKHLTSREKTSFWSRTKDLPSALLPLLLIFSVVLALILFGVATPTESAAFGVIASATVALIKRKLSFGLLLESAKATAMVSGAILLLVGAAGSFSQALATSGVLPGFLAYFGSLKLDTTLTIISLIGIIIVLGLFLETIAIILICAPFFMPIVNELGVDPIWFGVLWLVALSVGLTTPPFGMNLFVMRKVAPQFRMGVLYKAAMPFVASDIAVIALVFVFPILATGLVFE